MTTSGRLGEIHRWAILPRTPISLELSFLVRPFCLRLSLGIHETLRCSMRFHGSYCSRSLVYYGVKDVDRGTENQQLIADDIDREREKASRP